MIITKLQGGLGNQMLQYAAGKRLAEHHGTILKVDTSLYTTDQIGITPRHYELSCFKADVLFATDEEVRMFKKEKGRIGRIMERFARTLHIPGRYPLVRERHFHFDPEILAAPDNVYLEGYFVTERYFKDIEEDIRRDFCFKEPLRGENENIMKRIRETDSIAIHVRRGDYVYDKKTNDFHGVCGVPYYMGAIAFMSAKVRDPHFFVFSDDIDWVKKNITIDLPMEYIDHNKGKDAYKDMQLMSLCKHDIIANSTFSWWGAWLDRYEKKIVVAPKHWFADPSIDTKDVIPETWIRL